MRKEGLGLYIYPPAAGSSTGARYEGEWRDNVKDGRGVYYFPAVRERYKSSTSHHPLSQLIALIHPHLLIIHFEHDDLMVTDATLVGMYRAGRTRESGTEEA